MSLKCESAGGWWSRAGRGWSQEAVLPSSVYSSHPFLFSPFPVIKPREGESRAWGWPGWSAVTSTQTHWPTSPPGLPQLQRTLGNVVCGWVTVCPGNTKGVSLLTGKEKKETPWASAQSLPWPFSSLGPGKPVPYGPGSFSTGLFAGLASKSAPLLLHYPLLPSLGFFF